MQVRLPDTSLGGPQIRRCCLDDLVFVSSCGLTRTPRPGAHAPACPLKRLVESPAGKPANGPERSGR